ILVYISWVTYWMSSYPNWYAMFLGFLSLLFYSFYLEKEDHSLWWIFGVGILVGTSAVFKQNIGAFIMMALITFSIVSNLSIVGRNDLFRFKPSTFFRNIFKEIFALSIGVLVIVLFVLGLSSFYMPLSLLVSRVFFVAIKSTTTSLAIPFPSLLPLFSGGFGVRDSLIKIVFYIPVFVYGISLTVVVLKLFRNKQSKELIYFLLFLFFGIFTFLQVYPRSTLDYVIFSYAGAELLGCYLFYLFYLSLGDFLKRFIQNPVVLERIKSVGLSIFLSLILCFALLGIYKNIVVKKRGGVRAMNIPRSRLLVNPGIAGLMEGISGYIRAKTDPNEKIVVLPYGAMIYFLSERSNPTRFIFMFEGNWSAGEKVQKEVINVLDKEKIRYVIFQDIILFDGVYLRDYARILTDYIFSNYHQEERMSDYIILRRNN
ncbi:MAG: hypothetical protein HY776_00100, partial [Actinobacteria bacterium]|nr:hypothetical protein [Actinomycetota bacterium]